MTDLKPYRHRCPLSYRDVQELLQERGIEVGHDTLRAWTINFSPLIAEQLRQREPRRGSRSHIDEVCATVGGVRHRLFSVSAASMRTLGRWRAVDEHGVVLDVLRHCHRDTEAARTFLVRLLGEFYVPEAICTDRLASYGAAIRELPALQEVEHQRVIRAARCDDRIEQRASVASRAVLPKTIPLSHQGNRSVVRLVLRGSRAPKSESARPEHSPSPPHQNDGSRVHQKKRTGVLKDVRFSQQATDSGHVRCGVRSVQGWPELQATPAVHPSAT